MQFVRSLLRAKTSIVRAVPLMRDARVPFMMKAGTLLAALAVISPLDLLGDIPVIGLLDDAMLLSLVSFLFVRFASRYAPAT